MISLYKVFNELYEKTKDEIYFEPDLKSDDKAKIKLKKMCECNCCTRHMSCKPEYNVFKILSENKDRDEVEKIKEHVKSDIVFMGDESVKFYYSQAGFEMIEFLKNKKEITEGDEEKFQQILNSVLSMFYKLIITFNDVSEVKILCNIFEYRLMTLAMNETFLQADEKVKEDVIEELMKWGVECYDNLKEMFHFQSKQSEIFKKGEMNNYKSETLCRCSCRHFVRRLLVEYTNSI
jgi:hypothetical protein